MEHPISEKKLEWRDQVRSYESHDKVVADELAFDFSYVAAKKFTNENSELEYSVEIRNLKDEAKDDNEESGISQ